MRRLRDRDCLILAQNGHRAALEELVNRSLPVVYRLCRRLVGDRDAAADATQEVFARALGALNRVTAKGSFRSWLCTIAWNLLRDRGRKAAVRKIVRHGTELERNGETIFDPEDTRARTPLDIAASREQQELVAQALGRMEPHLRIILVLRDVEGLSYGELAAFLGCRLGTAKSRIHRARMALKDAMIKLRPSLFEE